MALLREKRYIFSSGLKASSSSVISSGCCETVGNMSSGGGSLGIGSDGGVEIEKCACVGRFSGVGIDGGGGVDAKGGGMKSACG